MLAVYCEQLKNAHRRAPGLALCELQAERGEY